MRLTLLMMSLLCGMAEILARLILRSCGGTS
jgi:hypothetical protein